jgi:riboflavin transporter
MVEGVAVYFIVISYTVPFRILLPMAERKFYMGTMRNVRNLVIVSMLSALAYVGMFIQVSFWLAPFLKFDLSDIFCLLGSIIFGPWIGLLVVFIKDVLHALVHGSEPIGMIMNFIAVGSMVVVAGLIYNSKHRSDDNVIKHRRLLLALTLGILVRVIIMIPTNWIVFLTTFYGDNFLTATNSLNPAGTIYIYVHNPIFNIIQGVISSAAFIPLYYVWRDIIQKNMNT